MVLIPDEPSAGGVDTECQAMIVDDHDRLKILVWEGDGFALWYKRLETSVFKLPRVEAGQASLELRASELAMLLDGIDLAKLRRLPRYARPAAGAKENIAI